MTPARPFKPPVSPPTTAGRRVRIVDLGKLKPFTAEGHRGMREAARDPQLTAGRKFPTAKD